MDQIAARVSTIVEGSPDQVWHALTDPALVREYFMGATVRSHWKVGNPITFSGEWQGKSFEDKGEILTAEPGKELRFSHWSPLSGSADAPENYHVVDITLDADGAKTRVTLSQSNLDGRLTDEDRDKRADYEANWSTVLEGLRGVVERSSHVS
jgi:uncharacterized protein YndB with AHSA1/START domain